MTALTFDMFSEKTVTFTERFPAPDPVNRGKDGHAGRPDSPGQVHYTGIVANIQIASFKEGRRLSHR